MAYNRHLQKPTANGTSQVKDKPDAITIHITLLIWQSRLYVVFKREEIKWKRWISSNSVHFSIVLHFKLYQSFCYIYLSMQVFVAWTMKKQINTALIIKERLSLLQLPSWESKDWKLPLVQSFKQQTCKHISTKLLAGYPPVQIQSILWLFNISEIDRATLHEKMSNHTEFNFQLIEFMQQDLIRPEPTLLTTYHIFLRKLHVDFITSSL